jgi:hypothetical protein
MAIYGDGKHNENMEHITTEKFYADRLSNNELEEIKSFIGEFFALVRSYRHIEKYLPTEVTDAFGDLFMEADMELNARLTDDA